MKGITLLAAVSLTLGAAGTAAAQSSPPMSGMSMTQGARTMPAAASARLTRLLQGITLPAATRARVDSIYALHAGEIPAAAWGANPDSTAVAAMRMHLGAADRGARGLLTPEQQQVWDRNLAALGTAAPRP